MISNIFEIKNNHGQFAISNIQIRHLQFLRFSQFLSNQISKKIFSLTLRKNYGKREDVENFKSQLYENIIKNLFLFHVTYLGRAKKL